MLSPETGTGSLSRSGDEAEINFSKMIEDKKKPIYAHNAYIEEHYSKAPIV